jgi:hypothetical protein
MLGFIAVIVFFLMMGALIAAGSQSNRPGIADRDLQY